MQPVNKLIVCVTIMFSLYFMGVLNIILQLTIDIIMPDFSSAVTIKEEVSNVVTIKEEPALDDPATNPFLEQTEGIYNKLQQTIDKKKIEMSAFMTKVVTTIEDLVKDADVESSNEQERQDTMNELYEKFPEMEKLFERVLAMDSNLGNDPTRNKDTEKRLASIKKMLQQSKDNMAQKLKEKGTEQGTIDQNSLEQDTLYQFEEEENIESSLNKVSSKTESENNISEPESKLNKNVNENEDPLKRINVNQNDNVRTEL